MSDEGRQLLDGRNGATTSDMGNLSSRPTRGVVLTFDALGTLYRFRRPVAEQYLNVARGEGLKTGVDLKDLEVSFRKNFKSINKQYPNYGKGKLEDPKSWWTRLVERSFSDILPEERLPPNLGSAMYEHFSSGKAYELYPDVLPFLKQMHTVFPTFQRQLETEEEDLKLIDDPNVMMGIITNSDPRVRQVLESLGIKVGIDVDSKAETGLDSAMQSLKTAMQRRAAKDSPKLVMPWADNWKPDRDFQFLTTSYQAESAKPNKAIFDAAEELAAATSQARFAWPREIEDHSLASAMRNDWKALQTGATTRMEMLWLHVGDDYEEDYRGAQNSGQEALLLARDGQSGPSKDTRTVTSLQEVAAIVGLMVDEMRTQG